MIFHSFRENGLTLTVFQITPRMSSYLPVLIVSDFSCKNGTAIDAGINGDLPVKVFLRSKTFIDYKKNSFKRFVLDQLLTIKLIMVSILVYEEWKL